MTMPVMPDDEPFDFLATQAVADFLATNTNPSLDGILYPSVQGGEGKLNLVLFHKAARVQPLDIPQGTVIDAQLYEHDEDGVRIYPWVWEEVPSNEASGEPAPIQLDPEPFMIPEALDALDPEDFYNEQREPVLKLDISSLQVHVVEAVEFKTKAHTVNRHRGEKKTRFF